MSMFYEMSSASYIAHICKRCPCISTEPTMIAEGRIFVERSLKGGGKTKWLGCIDHLLQLVNKNAFSDLPMSEGTLKACLNLVNFVNSSSQAT